MNAQYILVSQWGDVIEEFNTLEDALLFKRDYDKDFGTNYANIYRKIEQDV